MKIVARRALSVAFALALMVGGSALGTASASAEVVHNFEFSLDGSTTPEGFFEMSAVAVDQTSGALYVKAGPGIDRFDAAGNYLGEINGKAVPQGSLGLSYSYSGIAVDNSVGANSGDLYVAGTENGIVYKFDSSGKLLSEINGSGTPAGSFSPRGVAIDSSGDLYVADSANGVVDRFDASGKYVSQIPSLDIGSSTASIAVNSSGDVYINNPEESTVKLEPDGTTTVLDAGPTVSVAVDPASSNVYVAEAQYPGPGRIVEYDASGKRLGAFGEERFGYYVFGIAVNGATGEVDAIDYSKDLLDVFGPAVVIPDVTAEAPSAVQPTGVTLNGTVDPDGVQVSACRFEYGTSDAYGQRAPCAQSPSSIGSGTSPVPISADLSGLLQPDTEYHFRVDASNVHGEAQGTDMTFTTSGPPRVDSESATSITHTTVTLQAQIDPFGFATTYRFEYGTSASYGTSVPVPEADIGSGLSGVAVDQGIEGLQAGVTYHYRVVATSSQGTVDGVDRTLTTVPPAVIDGEWASNVAATSATLNAKVDPLGSNTEYRLEYGTTTSYGQTLVGSVGEGEADVLVSIHRQQLQPGTMYHYRITTTNIFGVVEDADHTFTTQPAGGVEFTLPDGRAWELVSPPNKNGSLIEGFDLDPIQAADDGHGITYLASEPIGENPVGKTLRSQILSTRGPDGWTSQDISLPHRLARTEETASEGFEYFLFSSNLSLAAIWQKTTAAVQLSSEPTEGKLYLRNDTDRSYLPLLTPANVPVGTISNGEAAKLAALRDNVVEFITATPDLSHVILKSVLALTPEALQGTSEENANLYEWSAGKLQLVNILPSPSKEPTLGAFLGGENIQGFASAPRAISSDGRWVVWATGNPYESEEKEPTSLYVRDMVAGKTVQIGGAYARFQTMSSDGSRIFFVEHGELYEFNVDTETQIDLTASHGKDESSAGVEQTVSDISEDGSYVYFVARGVLGGAGDAVEGEDNLYLAHDENGEWTTRYIATLSSADERSWYDEAFAGATQLGGVRSRISPDGRYLVFMSSRPLTGYDNIDVNSGQPDEEVYLYDALADRLVCASCDPTGARPVGLLDEGENVLMDRNINVQAALAGHWLAGIVPGWDNGVEGGRAGYQPRYLSDGGRLFFDSPDALVPQDTNGLMDVYEYEPAGTGSCEATGVAFNESSGGCVSLISSGTSGSESAFFDASENGDDVFFLTDSRLTAADYDTSLDVYDAHVCSTAAPCRVVPVSSPPCSSGDSCKAAPSAQPEVFGAAPSATFSGAGNVVERPAQGAVKPKAKPKGKPKRKTKHRRNVGRRTRRARRARARHTIRKGAR